MQQLLWTPETSGGLLAAVTPENVAEFVHRCPEAAAIGQVMPGDGHIKVSYG
jgi:selenophosphate synthase